MEGGATFAAALEAAPEGLYDLYANMVEAGEAGGILDTILNPAGPVHGKGHEAEEEGQVGHDLPVHHHRRWRSVVVVFLLIFVIPTFKAMFEGFGAALPAADRDRPRSLAT